jgi:hypothetical protein
MQIVTAFFLWLVFLNYHAVRIRVRIVTYACYLPGHLPAGLPTGYLEPVPRNLLGDI